MSAEHKIALIETNLADRRVHVRCKCGYRTGWRRNRPVALKAIEEHIDQMENMTAAKAESIRGDHVAGLHEEHYDDTVGCRWVGCAESHEILALAEERDRLARESTGVPPPQ